MSDRFTPIPMAQLARWIFRELDERDSIFGIPRTLFFEPKSDAPFGMKIYDRLLETPIGVAAGPHTQLAQNIVVAWLLGSRFLELKTVQTLDELDVSKPCIDAEDATYNCEWSQELKLHESADEYEKAWVLIYALRQRLGWRAAAQAAAPAIDHDADPGFVFNLSVGYNLEGIKKPNVQAFLARMKDASSVLPGLIDDVAAYCPEVRQLAIPPRLSDNITLSTMHGCPPQEIEQIGLYLLEELGVHTAIKMNPTLLGSEMLRGILNDELGFKDITVPDEAFAHDTKYPDALAMIGRLRERAAKTGRHFGLKLTNTLEVQNHRKVFPSNETMMYMSGRALHPLTINVASRLRRDLGPLRMSLSGGADAFNLADILACGLSPVTVCTDLLKPGGYTRLPQYLERLGAAMEGEDATSLDSWACRRAGLPADGNADEAALANLQHYAQTAAKDERYRVLHHPAKAKGPLPLGWFDCIDPPCRDGCPTHQNIPEYLHLVAKGKYTQAMEVIRETNALPRITGCVCDHPCEVRCVRNHYDAPLAIRGIKRFVAEHVGPDELERSMKNPPVAVEGAPSVAIVGGGPAGLSAAYYLAKTGCAVTLYEGRDEPGGTVTATIPRFRLELGDIMADAKLLKVLGVKVRYGQKLGRDITFAALREAGHAAIVLATGANIGRQMGVEGEDAAGVYDGYSFLSEVRANEDLPLGPQTIIVGGGNAAMDAARTAWRLAGKSEGKVTVLYRRTRAEMPADPDEIRALAEENVHVEELASPLKLIAGPDGRVAEMVCQRMRLSEPDASGRPRPVPIEGSQFTIPCSTVVVCVSQEADLSYLGDDELKLTRWGTLKVDEATGATSVAGIYAGGDVARGPSTIIQAVADGRRMAAAILTQADMALPPETPISRESDELMLRELRAVRVPRVEVDVRAPSKRRDFEEVEPVFTEDQARLEAARCLLCDEMCNLCVTVCPNMANLSYDVAAVSAQLPQFTLGEAGKLVEHAKAPVESFAVAQQRQIVNIANFCNECGNCDTFCPTSGAPYKEKPRLCLDKASFEREEDRAVYIEKKGDTWQLAAKIDGEARQLRRENGTLHYRSPRLEVTLDAKTLALLGEARPGPEAKAGEALSLRPAAELAVLLEGMKASLPWIF